MAPGPRPSSSSRPQEAAATAGAGAISPASAILKLLRPSARSRAGLLPPALQPGNRRSPGADAAQAAGMLGGLVWAGCELLQRWDRSLPVEELAREVARPPVLENVEARRRQGAGGKAQLELGLEEA